MSFDETSIRVYTLCSGLSVRVFTVNMVYTLRMDILSRLPNWTQVKKSCSCLYKVKTIDCGVFILHILAKDPAYIILLLKYLLLSVVPLNVKD